MKNIVCCGDARRTPFCSSCGKKLNGNPLTDLLLYCRNEAERLRKRQLSPTSLGATGAYSPANLKVRADAWDDRVIALEALMIHAAAVIDELSAPEPTPTRPIDVGTPF